MNEPVIVAGVSGLLGGGSLSAAVAYWTARRRVPAETDSIIVGSAETTVQAALAVAAAESARADRAEAAAAAKDKRIEALEAKIDFLQTALDAVRAEVHAIKTDSH